jgi:hypothetical protein
LARVPSTSNRAAASHSSAAMCSIASDSLPSSESDVLT